MENFFNGKYQQDMRAIAQRTRGNTQKAAMAQSLLALTRKQALPCGHDFFYPFTMAHNRVVCFPVHCVKCQTYSILQFHFTNNEIETAELLGTFNDKTVAKKVYESISLDERQTMSGAEYKASMK